MHFIDFFILRIKSRAESKETGSNEFEYLKIVNIKEKPTRPARPS